MGTSHIEETKFCLTCRKSITKPSPHSWKGDYAYFIAGQCPRCKSQLVDTPPPGKKVRFFRSLFQRKGPHMWPFKKKKEVIPSVEGSKNTLIPNLVRKKQTVVQASRVIALAALFGHPQLGNRGIDFLNDCRRYYDELNPGLTVTIEPSDFLIIFSPSNTNRIDEMMGKFLISPEIQRFGRTSKVIQTGLMSSFAVDETLIRVPTAFVTIIRKGKKEPETIEFLCLIKGSIQFI